MGFFKSTKGSIISDFFTILHDLGQLKEGYAVDVALYDDHLTLVAPIYKTDPITLDYKQINDVYYGFETEIVEKDKSVIGRAAAGGLVFGPIGAIVGAVSGIGSKKQEKKKTLFIISYISSSGEQDYLRFEDTRHYRGLKVSEKLQELCNIHPEILEKQEKETITKL